MKSNNITLKILFLIVLNDIGDSVAQLLLKKGFVAGGVGPVGFANIGEFIARNSTSPFVWLGLLVYALNFFIWIIILYRVDLSVAMPVGSTSYIMIPFLAIFFLGEHVSPLRWLGTILIALGIWFVMQSPKHQERTAAKSCGR